MYLRLESSETFQSHAIKRVLTRHGWFDFTIIASDHVDSLAFVQYLINITATSSKKWNVVNSVVFGYNRRDVNIKLATIFGSPTRVFVLHATPEYASMLFEEAEDFGLLGKGNVWLVTENVVTKDPFYLNRYPEGLLGFKYIHDMDDVIPKILDSVELLARASMKFQSNLKLESNRSCWYPPTKASLEYGRQYYSSLVSTPFEGHSGFISFDEQGNLDNAAYEIVNTRHSNGHIRWKKVGYWNATEFNLEGIHWPGNNRELPHGINTEKIMVVANEEKPFIFENEPHDSSHACLTGVPCFKASNSDRADIEKAFAAYEEPTVHSNYTSMKRCCSGLGVDLLERLSDSVEFEYYLYLVSDLNHGARVEGKWNGMVGDLLQSTADIAISSFSITAERSKVIDFTSPFFHSGFSTLVAKTQVEPQLDSFLAPLEWTVWILVFVTVNIVAIAITVFEWMSPYGLHPRGRNRHYTFGLPSALNIAFSILFSHTVKSKPPKCMTSRFLLNVWGAFSFIFFASYTANLAAFMAGQMSHLQIDGIQDDKCYVVVHLIIDVVISTANARSGDLDAFIYDSPVIEYRMANDPHCRLISVGKTFGEEGYGIGLPKGSPLKDALSIFILEYETDGYLEELQKKWFGTMTCYKESNIQTADIGDHKVRLAHVAGLFLMLLMGFGIGFLILLLEHLVYKYGIPKLHLHAEHKRNWLVLSQRLHRAVNTEDLIPSRTNMQEVITMFKKGQFTRMFQREQLRRRSMLRRESNYDAESNTTFKDLIDSMAWAQKRGSEQNDGLQDRRHRTDKHREAIMMGDLDKDKRRNSDSSDSDSSYDNLARFSPTGELLRFSPHGDVISQSLSESINNLDQLENTRWTENEQDSFISLHSNPERRNTGGSLKKKHGRGQKSDLEEKKMRQRFPSGEDTVAFLGPHSGNNEGQHRQNGRAKFVTWTDDDDDDMFDPEPSENHPMMPDEDLPQYHQCVQSNSRYANTPYKSSQSEEDYYNPYSYDPYDPTVFDARNLSKEELLVRWRLSQREMTKRLGKALSEKAKLEMKVSELQAQLDDR
ncbi:glutamate receptor ionotropic, NMDA 3B-like [Glandiceps talaboti]